MIKELNIEISQISNGFVVYKRDMDWDYDCDHPRNDEKIYCSDKVAVVKAVAELTNINFGD